MEITPFPDSAGEVCTLKTGTLFLFNGDPYMTCTSSDIHVRCVNLMSGTIVNFNLSDIVTLPRRYRFEIEGVES